MNLYLNNFFVVKSSTVGFTFKRNPGFRSPPPGGGFYKGDRNKICPG